jgi:microcystin-dependent protein
MREGSVPAGTDVALQTEVPGIGAIIPWAPSALPAGGKWDWADGALIDRTAFAAYMAAVGHAYNGGVDPGSNKVRKPDKRGRLPVGADNFGQGAAGRLPNSNRARGQSGGEERHTLSPAESGVNSNGGTTADTIHTQDASSSNAAQNWPNLTMHDSTGHQFDGQSGLHGHGLAARTADAPHNNMPPYECDFYIVRVA